MEKEALINLGTETLHVVILDMEQGLDGEIQCQCLDTGCSLIVYGWMLSSDAIEVLD